MARIAMNRVVAWLVTQTNSRGTLYSETLARQYMGAVAQAPERLGLPSDLAKVSAFEQCSAAELERLWQVWKTAPNYTERNRQTGNALSAGMGCLLQYLRYRESQSLRVRRVPRQDTNPPAADEQDNQPASSNSSDTPEQPIRLLRQFALEYIDKRPKGGVLWVIGDQRLADTMEQLRQVGFPFTFKPGGGIASGWRDA